MARGQVSLFIIVGVIILAVFAIVVIPGPEDNEKSLESKEVDMYMTQCTKNKAERAMWSAGKTGGMFKEEVMFTAYVEDMPSIEGIKSNVSKLIKKGIRNCSRYDFAGKNVTTGNLSVEVEFDKSTKVYVDNFYQVRMDNKVERTPKYEFELEIPFMKIYKAAEVIVNNKYIPDKDELRKQGLKIEGMDKGDYELWAVSSEEYVFAFAKNQ